jgi:hypothetical protein
MAAVATPQQQQISPQQRMANFNALTRLGTLQLATLNIPINSAGQAINQQLQTTGYCPGILLLLKGTFTTTAFTGKTVAVANAPAFDLNPLLANIRLFSVGGTTFFQGSAETAYLVNRQMFPSIDPRNLFTGSATTNTNAAIWYCPQTIAASTTYNVSAYYYIPFAENPDWRNGLQNLNNSTNIMSLQIVPGSINQCFTVSDASAFTSVIASSSFTLTIEQDYATQPLDPAAQPMPSYSLVNQEFLYSVNSQNQEFPIQVGPTYTKIIAEFYTSAGARYTPASFNSVQVKFGGVNIPYTNTAASLAVRNMLITGSAPMPDGVLVHNFANSSTGTLISDGKRDLFPTQNLSQFSVIYNLTNAPAAGDLCRLILQSLISNS